METTNLRRGLWTLAVGGLVIATWGCGATHQEHARVHGKVTYKGKPVPLGSVLFVPAQEPEDAPTHPASGTINSDGTYELHSEEEAGAVLGEHKVIVVAVDGGKPAAAPDPSKPPAVGAGPPVRGGQFRTLVPQKYSNPVTTPLTRKVVAGDNAIDIELTD